MTFTRRESHGILLRKPTELPGFVIQDDDVVRLMAREDEIIGQHTAAVLGAAHTGGGAKARNRRVAFGAAPAWPAVALPDLREIAVYAIQRARVVNGYCGTVEIASCLDKR